MKEKKLYNQWWFLLLIPWVILAIYSSLDGKKEDLSIDNIETKQVTETNTIKCEEVRLDDPELAKGEEIVDQECVDGKQMVTYRIESKNGVEISREKIYEQTTSEPVNRIVRIGSYVAPAATPAPSTPYVAPPAPSPATTPSPAPLYPDYENCTDLNKDYPHGIGRSGAVDKGGSVTNFYADTAFYNSLRKTLDRDKDGIACER